MTNNSDFDLYQSLKLSEIHPQLFIVYSRSHFIFPEELFFCCVTINLFSEHGIYREAGVGFASSPPQIAQHDYNRTELLKLLLTCFSEAIYLSPTGKYVVYIAHYI